MNEKEISVELKARYYTLGEFTPNTTKIWFVLHGYGQLSRFFINKFKVLADAGVYVVAPEGLSKFYLEDVESRLRSGNNRVGATWMTRENRLMDIDNYIAYLNAVYKNEVAPDFSGELTILGFSQGAATATRWAVQNRFTYHTLILWSGVFPPDMNFEVAHQVLKDKKIIEVFGKNDPFISEDRMKELNALHDQLRIVPQRIEFEGSHELNENVLKDLI